jgi:hypothetical protein
VLLSNDWSRWRPRVVLLEATLPGQRTPCHEAWEDVILGAGYLFAHFDGLNRYYVRHEDQPLLERFAAPVCFFDNCVEHWVVNLVERLENEMVRLQGEVRHYGDMLSDVGPRSLRISLGLGRRFTRLIRACKQTIARPQR